MGKLHLKSERDNILRIAEIAAAVIENATNDRSIGKLAWELHDRLSSFLVVFDAACGESFVKCSMPYPLLAARRNIESLIELAGSADVKSASKHVPKREASMIWPGTLSLLSDFIRYMDGFSSWEEAKTEVTV